MEKRIMRKHLIETILVLAALAACNKEIETSAPVVDNGQEETTPGKVTLTFTATISEETRTAYDDKLKGSWVLGDKITVCVFNNNPNKPDYKTAVFEATTLTDTGMEFTGVVDDGYTTIVSGVYPANSQHVFDAGVVKHVYLSEEYNLFDVDDEGNHVSTFNDEGIALPMVGQMVDDTFTFHHICGALKITVIDIFNALTFTTASEPITGLFELDGNGRITMENAAITCSNAVTFNYDRLYLGENPDVGARDNSYRTFYIPIPDGTISGGAKMTLKSGNSVVFEKTTSNDNNITFNSNVIKRLKAITFNRRTDWQITPDLTGEHPIIHFEVSDQNEQYLRISTTKDNFDSNHHGSVAEFLENRIRSSNNTQTGTTTYPFSSTSQEKYYDDGHEKVYIMVGVNGTSSSSRKATFDYQICYFDVPDPATDEYKAWLGEWTVSDGSKTDNWTISRKATNESYAISGIAGRSDIDEVVGVFSKTNNTLTISSQSDVGTYNSHSVSLMKIRASDSAFISTIPVIINRMQLNNGAVSFISDYNHGYGFYWKNDQDKWVTAGSSLLKRGPISSITRPTE